MIENVHTESLRGWIKGKLGWRQGTSPRSYQEKEIDALCDQALIPEPLQQPMQEVIDLFATNGHHNPLDTEVERINTGLERIFRSCWLAHCAEFKSAGLPQKNNAALALIEFALSDDCDGSIEQLLKAWQEGDFDAIRQEWPSAPDGVFIGAELDYDAGFEAWFKHEYPLFDRAKEARDTSLKHRLRAAFTAGKERR